MGVTCMCQQYKQETIMQEEETYLQVTLQLQPTVDKDKNDYPLPKDRSLTFSQYPQTGLEVKRRVQDKFKIPLCLQTIYFNSFVLEDNQELRNIHFREGDTLTVSYTTHGDLSTVQDIINAITTVSGQLESIKESILDGSLTQEEYDQVLDYNFVDHINESFVRTTPDIVKVHHLYFIHNFGADVFLKVKRLLAEIPWGKLPYKLQCLEHAALKYFWSLSSTIGVRCYLFNFPDLVELIASSILRIKAIPNEKLSIVNMGYAHLDGYYSVVRSSITIMYSGIGTMANLAELIEFREEIASIPNLLDQMTSIMLCPQFGIVNTHLGLSTLFALSFSPSCHHKIASPLIIERIMEASSHKRLASKGTVTEHNSTMINYFMSVFLALVSPMLSRKEEFHSLLLQVIAHMQQFVQKTNYEAIHEAEVKTGHEWSTIKPILCLVYRTIDEYNDIPLLPELYRTSLQVGLISLQEITFASDFKEIVENEGLHDYLMILPWYMKDDELREEAEVLYRLVQAKVKTSCPPTLVNLIKGYLATNTGFTLQELMSPSFIETLDQRLTYT